MKRNFRPSHPFRTIKSINFFPPDTLAHQIIPLHPTLKPHARMLHHFRFLMPLIPKDEDGLTPLHYYDSAVQVARNLSSGKEGKEMTEQEFEVGMRAAEGIEKWCVIFVI